MPNLEAQTQRVTSTLCSHSPKCELLLKFGPWDLQKSIDENDPENSALDSFSLELFEDISYIMAKHADPQGVPDTPDEWLDQFGTFSIYQVLPEIIELWGLNVQTQVESKKNFERLTGK